MAKTKKKEKQAEQDAAPQELPPQSAEQAPPSEEKQPPTPPKESHLLLNILTVLLAFLGIGEVVLLGYVGFQAFRGVQAKNRYQAQINSSQSEEAQPVSGASYLGPGLQIENGEVVWRSPNSPLGGVGTGASSVQTGLPGGGDTRLSSLTVPQIPYRLAEEDSPTQT